MSCDGSQMSAMDRKWTAGLAERLPLIDLLKRTAVFMVQPPGSRDVTVLRACRSESPHQVCPRATLKERRVARLEKLTHIFVARLAALKILPESH